MAATWLPEREAIIAGKWRDSKPPDKTAGERELSSLERTAEMIAGLDAGDIPPDVLRLGKLELDAFRSGGLEKDGAIKAATAMGMAPGYGELGKSAAASFQRLEALQERLGARPPTIELSREARLGPGVIAVEQVQTQVEALNEAVGIRLDTLIEAQKELVTLVATYVTLFSRTNESNRRLAIVALAVAVIGVLIALFRP